MPFLAPATVALLSDVTVVVLHLTTPSSNTYHQTTNNNGGDENNNHHDWVYRRTAYTWVTALCRLFLLAVPLYYHSYTGTAVHLVQLYRLFYGGCLTILFLHMVLLAIYNPASLEGLFFWGDSQQHHVPHFLRDLWYMLGLSFGSTLCHTIVLQHVRSTGPPETTSGPVPTVYFAVRTANRLWQQHHNSNNNGGSNNEEEPPAYIHAMNEFVIDMQARLQRARTEWTSRVDDVVTNSHNNNKRHKFTPPLQALLRLFAHDQAALDQLSKVFDHDNGECLIFYIPQLVSFLLHGALYSSPVLEEWILEKCSRNVYFAHRCYWFLRAWCLELSSPSPLVSSSSNNTNNNNNNLVSTASGDDDDDSVVAITSQYCQPKPPLPAASARAALLSHDGKFYPEERAMIERLMMRVKDRGLHSANAEWDALIIMEPAATSPAAMVEAAQLGHIPVDPATGCPSVRHFDAIMNHRNKSITAFANFLSSSSSDDGNNDNGGAFEQTPRFLDALIYIADSLFLVPREERRDTLRQQLRALECELLPSHAVYLPTGNRRQHQVWRIAADECIPISTKERVPCIIYLEVIDSIFSSRGVRPIFHLQPSWKESLLRANSHNNGGHSTLAAATAANTNPTLELHMSTSSLMDENGSYDDEGQVLWDWRFAPRNPLRRVSLLDKVTTTVKAPLDKMKTKLRDHLLASTTREKTDEELQSLAEEFLLGGVNGTGGGTTTMEYVNCPSSRAEQGLMAHHSSSHSPPPPSMPLSRNTSTGSLVSLGQWSAPAVAPSTPAKFTRSYSSDCRARTDSMDASVGGKSSHSNNNNNNLMYGTNGDVAVYCNNNEARKPSAAGEPTQEQTSTRPPPVVFRESWATKQERVRQKSAFGDHPGWRLLPILIKANDDLRQEQLAGQLIQRMAMILARERVNVWLCPYDILALTDRAGIIEAIPDTISLDSLKKNSPNYTNLLEFFYSHYGEGTEELAAAKANFVESLAAYSIVCFLLQIKDRHNGNILLDKWGHVIHIDFGFFLLSSPGKNVGFESAPFKLTREFVEVLEGPESHLFRTFRDLCCKTFLALRRNCMEIILVVEMLQDGNENLQCFRGHPKAAIQQLRDRFRLDLNDRACKEYVNSLIDDSIENWRTDWYDRYQRYFVGVL